MKCGIPQKVSSRAFVVHNIYRNDLSLRINSVSEPVLLVDDTSVIISSRNSEYFCSMSNLVLSHVTKWFAGSKFVLILECQLHVRMWTDRVILKPC
jgi:hypothetical protein